MKTQFKVSILMMTVVLAASVSGSALSDLAGSMKAGEWRELTTQNILPVLTNTGGSSNMIFGYSESMRWDPVSRRAYYLGSDHGGDFNEAYRFVCYDEATNTWIRLTQPPWSVSPPGSYYDAHGYDHTAIDPEGRKLYRRPYNSSTIRVYDIDAGTWSALPTAGGSGCCNAIDFFPELNGLVWSTGASVGLFNRTTQAWASLGTASGLASTWMVAEYNPVHKLMILTSSTRNLYKLSDRGRTTRLQNLAVSIYSGSAWNGIVTVDPVSGDYLVFTPDSRQFHIYDVTTDTWRQAPNQPSPDMVDGGVAATPVPTYGVVLFTHCQRYGQVCRVLIYKHADGTAAEARARAGEKGSISISPNPFSRSALAVLPAWIDLRHATLKVYDINGRVVQDLSKKLVSRRIAIHGKGLMPGVYLVRLGVQSGNRQMTKKIVIQK
jgi:hypothetical protein